MGQIESENQRKYCTSFRQYQLRKMKLVPTPLVPEKESPPIKLSDKELETLFGQIHTDKEATEVLATDGKQQVKEVVQSLKQLQEHVSCLNTIK